MSGTAGRDTPAAGSPAAASPRSTARPMAFTTGELHRGAAKAGLWFLALLYPAICGYVLLAYLTGGQPFAASAPGDVILASLLYALIGILVGCVAWVPGALAALLIGTPAAQVLGRLLERTRSVWVHVLAFAIFGLILGEVVAVATLWIEGGWDGGNVALLAVTSVPLALAGAGAVCLGWRSAFLRAMKDDLALAAAD